MLTTKTPLVSLEKEVILPEQLRQYTFARVGLPQSGHSISLSEILSFRADYAAARDALHTDFETKPLQNYLQDLGLPELTLTSKAHTKATYLQRPDLGRLLDDSSIKQLYQHPQKGFDIAIIVTNGLSAQAVNINTIPLFQNLLPLIQASSYTLAPIVLAHNGRVALADQIGELLQARLSIILVGERPGLSSPDSMGAYLTYAPQTGLTDERRNCISNIRNQGLPPAFAAEKLFHLATESLTQKLSGVHLKDDMKMVG